LILARNCISQYREQFFRRRSLFVFNFQSTLLLRVKETFDRSMVGHFIAAFSVLFNAETMLCKTDGSNNFHLHHHLVEYDALLLLLLLLTMLFDDHLLSITIAKLPSVGRLFQLWCVAFGRPSITALTWCRGISWSGALNIFFDDWRRSIIIYIYLKKALKKQSKTNNNFLCICVCVCSVEGKKWKKAGMFAHFFCRKAVQSFCYHMYISQWNGLTDRTSCFDRKLCTDLSWLCKTSRFCLLD
ncbi:hypothetical protein T08_2970, partial [Trichinella sp. T8]